MGCCTAMMSSATGMFAWKRRQPCTRETSSCCCAQSVPGPHGDGLSGGDGAAFLHFCPRLCHITPSVQLLKHLYSSVWAVITPKQTPKEQVQQFGKGWGRTIFPKLGKEKSRSRCMTQTLVLALSVERTGKLILPFELGRKAILWHDV